MSPLRPEDTGPDAELDGVGVEALRPESGARPSGLNENHSLHNGRGPRRSEGLGWGPSQLAGKQNKSLTLESRPLSLVLPHSWMQYRGLTPPNPGVTEPGSLSPLPRPWQLMLSEEAVSSPGGPPGPGLSRFLLAEISSQPSPRWVENQNDFLNWYFPVESTFYAFFPRSFNYQMFAFLRRPKIAEIWGI